MLLGKSKSHLFIGDPVGLTAVDENREFLTAAVKRTNFPGLVVARD